MIMNITNKYYLLIIGTFVLSTLSLKAQSGQKVTWKKSPTGMEYAIVRHDNKAKKAAQGDFIFMNLSYSVKRNGVDSTIFDSKSATPQGKMILQIQESTYKGDIMEGISMLCENDSALFILQADSFFLKTVRAEALPPFIQSKDKVQFRIGVTEIATLQEMQAKEAAEQAKQEENMKSQKEKETAQISEYLAKSGHVVSPDENGLFIVRLEQGSGEMPANGKKVNVHYTGKLLNGTVFDSSVERGQPFSFTLGQGMVIKGWDLGIAALKPGEKAILGIPSWLAYGARATGPIPANSPLIFEVQLLSYD
jgi:FKBP-type peptidyl-prolyl cis-trans isomerase FkpA